MANNISYSEKLKHPLWQKKRLEIMQRDGFKCTLCGDNDTTLAVHHLAYENNPWEVDNSKLITVCKHCHIVLEKYKELTDYFSGIIEIKKMIIDDSLIELFIHDSYVTPYITISKLIFSNPI